MMKLDVIVISGKQGSGKDETFKQLRDLIAEKQSPDTWVVLQASFAAPIRQLSEDIRKFMNDHDQITPPSVAIKDGELMQMLGAWGRKRYGVDVWLDIMSNKVEQIYETHLLGGKTERLTFVITDCRFENEFLNFPEGIKVRLECPEEVRRNRAENWRENTTHESETGLDEFAAREGMFDMTFRTDILASRTVAEQIYMKMLEIQP